MATHKPSQGYASQAPVRYESVIPNPNLKLLDQMNVECPYCARPVLGIKAKLKGPY